MSVGIFIFGLVVSGFVAGACWLVAAGIREERRDRKTTEAEQSEALEVAERHPVATRADGRTIEADQPTPDRSQ